MPTLKTYKNGQWVEIFGTPAASIDELVSLAERMTVAEGDIVTLKADMSTKANIDDLAAIATTGNVNDLNQNAEDELVLDCGLSY